MLFVVVNASRLCFQDTRVPTQRSQPTDMRSGPGAFVYHLQTVMAWSSPAYDALYARYVVTVQRSKAPQFTSSAAWSCVPLAIPYRHVLANRVEIVDVSVPARDEYSPRRRPARALKPQARDSCF